MRSVFLTSVSNTLEIGNASDIIWLIFCSDIIWLIFVLLLGLDGGPGSQQPPPQGTPGIPQQQVQFRQPLPPGMHPRPGQVIKREKILRDTSRFRTKPEFFWDKNALQRPSFQICSDVAKCAWTAKGAKNFFVYKKRIIFSENYSFSIRTTLLEFNSGWFYPVLKNFEAALKKSSWYLAKNLMLWRQLW